MTSPIAPPSYNELEPIAVTLGEPPAAVIAELTSGLVRINRRVEIYESDGVTPFDITNWNARLVDGSITIDRDRDERRSCDFLLDNTDGALINDPYDGFWYDKILKAFWGIRYYDSDPAVMRWKRWETQIGEFMIDRLDEDRFPNAVKATGRDYAKKCIMSKLSTSLSFSTGLRVEDIIRALAANCGITKFAMPITNQAYQRDLVFTRGQDRWEVMKQLADTIGYEVYFRADGALTMRPYPDPTTSAIAWSFSQDYGGTLVKYSRSSNDSRMFNHVYVSGAALGADVGDGNPDDAPASEVIFAEAKNTDPSSPTRIARVGDRVQEFESDLFTSVAQAQSYANTMLSIGALEEYTMSFESAIIPWLDGSDIVEIVEDNVTDFTPRRFLLSAFTLPMKLGPMSGTARRVTIVGSDQTLENI